MAKRIIIIRGDDTQTIWEESLPSMVIKGWVPVVDIETRETVEICTNSDEEIEDGNI
ncbi:MAG: hypothetical protein ACO23R_02695 [bacterium]